MKGLCALVSVAIVLVSVPGVAAVPNSARTAAESGVSPGRVDPNFQLLQRAALTEGFEGGVVPPTGWVLHQTNANQTWGVGTSDPHSGTYYADCVYDPNLGLQEEVLYSPQVTPTTALMVRFWSQGSVYWGVDPYDNYDLNVYLDEDTTWGNGNETLVYTADDDWVASWTWYQSTVDLNTYADGTSYYVAFAYEGTDGAEASLDDIEIFTDGDVPSVPTSGCGTDTTVLEEHFESWPPTGWAIVDNAGTCVWESTATTGRTNYAGGDGDAADADADWCYGGMDSELRTPLMDLSGYSEASINFIAAYNDIASNDSFAVDVSSDGGSSWTNLMTWNEDHDPYGPGELVELDLTPYLSASVMVRFHYWTTSWDWWAMVDDVYVCGVMAGGGSDLAITKTSNAGGTMFPGDQVTYSFTVTNNGPGDATGVTVTDVLPAELGFVSSTAGSFDGGTHTWTWGIGALANGASANCDLVTEVMPGANGVIENTGVVAGNETDPTPTNDSSMVPIEASSKVPGIPTLSTSGMAVLLLVLAGVAVAILRRRA